ncbi:EF-hand domain-containing protein [Pseudodesulfovibrio portus]|uniref:EF-hand domain-containing protein n=1 Tax=Pseudodesulfovibrio portus TaxID=231439 RepID=A0ABM8AQV1_9BACT|nr:EF-hand domain-containing protein [Pseudodesulfovibrio portus]BDQ33794.1 hypothetical protein JCM14722_13360 [Pseudodesulfovibrio portus]
MSIDSVSGSSASLNLAEMMQQARNERPDPDEMAEFIIGQDDTDGDGVLTLEETPLDAERFGQIDADGDGFITAEELSADAESHAQGPEAMGGGKGAPPSDSESGSGESEEEYDAYDLNEDGVVTLDELLQAFRQGDDSLNFIFGESENGVSALTQRLAMAAYQAQAAE